LILSCNSDNFLNTVLIQCSITRYSTVDNDSNGDGRKIHPDCIYSDLATLVASDTLAMLIMTAMVTGGKPILAIFLKNWQHCYCDCKKYFFNSWQHCLYPDILQWTERLSWLYFLKACNTGGDLQPLNVDDDCYGDGLKDYPGYFFP
jgi:hypothetical protein